MKSRITGLTVLIVALFATVLGMAWFVQVHHASALNGSTQNPIITADAKLYPRGEILAGDGTVLSRSIPTGSSSDPWRRSYPLGKLTSDIVGYSSLKYGTGGIEYNYDGYLVTHAQPIRNLSDFVNPVHSDDTVAITLEVALQQVAARALAGRDGAVVAIDPRNGSVLAMYSNPTYNPAPLTSINFAIQTAAWKKYNTNDALNFPPLGSVATQQTFPPGSTFKVVTTAGVLRYAPALQYASFPYSNQLSLKPYSNKVLYNAGLGVCGGTIQKMLPASCDPGYAWLGEKLGGEKLHAEAQQFGYNAIPPLDIPGVVASVFPPAKTFDNGNIPFLAYSAIGQYNVRSTALQDALVAAGIANGGKVMAPHFLHKITDSQGNVVKLYRPYVWRHALGPVEAATVSALMRGVVTGGTATQVGFLAQDEVAAKTGTAQTAGQTLTDDWMIAFAPASHPLIAVAVVVPNQPLFDWGATVAGPIMKCVIEGALAIDAKQPPAGTYDTCPR